MKKGKWNCYCNCYWATLMFYSLHSDGEMNSNPSAPTLEWWDMYLVCVTFLLRPLVSDTNPLGKVHICGHLSYNGRCFRTRSGLSGFLFDPWSPVPTDYGRYHFADIGHIMDVVSRQGMDSFTNFQGSEALVCGHVAVQGRRLCDAICIYFVKNFSYLRLYSCRQ